ncbi:MAG TPA: ATP-dependent DNA ligase [Polyangiaceae bacterium]|nr:ATP-dependent DNA ligase [Polyangiaceae bacterium]
MKFGELVAASRDVAEVRARSKKIERLAACLAAMDADETRIGVAYLSGDLRQGKIGIGYRTVHATASGDAALAPELTLSDVDRAFEAMASIAGSGSTQRRQEALAALFRRATREEQDFLVRLIVGELRQGALEGILLEAIARAANVSASSVRRAAMLTGDASTVAAAAREGGEARLATFRLTPLTPLKPMLAQTAEDFADLFSGAESVAVEDKLDGARIQVHRVGDEVRVFTRQLNDVAASVPEIVDVVRRLPVHSVVLDGEAIAMRKDGRPETFQTTMRRFGRRLDVETLRNEIPLSAFFFDCMHVDGEDLIDQGQAERFAVLSRIAGLALVVTREIVRDEAGARAFYERALSRGHEGLMAKALDAPYEAGRRGAAWLKLKPAHTLDLVVVAVEWGSGRRKGFLSNLHLGARDPETGGFVMLGKTFKGMTDELLEWQTKKLLALEVSRNDFVVFVRPELVVEIAFDGVQTSTQYPGGVALRFARVKRYREDKRALDSDTIEQVRAYRDRSGGPDAAATE